MPRASPFRWSRVGARRPAPGWAARPDDDDDDGEGSPEDSDDDDGDDVEGAEHGEEAGEGEEPDFEQAARQAKFMEDLARYM